jgi:hypothetical protein
MTPVEALAAARAAGVVIEARIWCDNPDHLPLPIRDALREHRAEILRRLVDAHAPRHVRLSDHPVEAASITVPCSRCGTLSRRYLSIINPDLWQCDACLPTDPNDHAYKAIERQAIIAEGKPSEPVLVDMPPSWSDASLEPTPGARCRCCGRAGWWCEATSPRGWRCSTCYPGDHLAADQRRDVLT